MGLAGDLGFELEKLEIGFGDVVLLRCPSELQADAMAAMQRALRSIGEKGVLVLIVPPGYNIQKLDDEEKQHLANIVTEHMQ